MTTRRRHLEDREWLPSANDMRALEVDAELEAEVAVLLWQGRQQEAAEELEAEEDQTQGLGPS